jgi:hypothetical protein
LGRIKDKGSLGGFMAFLHCHSCDWSQDDFYHIGYNPAQYLLTWNTYLFGDKHHRLDEPFTQDAQFILDNGNITTREVLAREFAKFAKRIRNMKWVTYKDFMNESIDKKVCPKCGSKDLDID